MEDGYVIGSYGDGSAGRSRARGVSGVDGVNATWARGDDDAASYVPAALASVGLSIDMILPQMMRILSADVERLDRMLVSAEARRSAALRELDYHRGPLARKLRRAIAEAEASEFTPDAPRIAAQAQPA